MSKCVLHGLQEDSPTSTAHFPFGLSHDPYDTFVKQQLMLLEDEPLSGQSVKAVRCRDGQVQGLQRALSCLQCNWEAKTRSKMFGSFKTCSGAFGRISNFRT